MRFDINLASRPFQDARSLYMRWGAILGGIACITAALVIIAVSHWRDGREINQKTAEVREQIARVEAQERANQALLNSPANRDTRQRAQFLNGLIVRKSFSWTRAFSDLEKIMPTHVHLLQIEPELTAQNELQIKMTVVGNSRDKALDLVRKLETSNEFRHAQIRAESAKPGADADNAVQFEISAVYVPPRPQTKTFAGKPLGEGE